MEFMFVDASKFRNAKKRNKYIVNINKNGRINFNQKITTEMIIHNNYAMLGYAKENPNHIAIKFLNENNDNKCLPIRQLGKTKSTYISAKGFFDNIGMNNIENVAGSYDANEENGIISFIIKGQ